MSTDRTEDCCTSTPPIVIEGYERQGTVKETAAGLKYYEIAPTGDALKYKDLAIIVIYDIYGSESPQTLQQCDRVSAGLGCKVVMPFWFGVEGAYPGDHTVPGGKEAMWEWIGKMAPPEKIVERNADIHNTLKAEGITKFGLVGYCFGGIQALALASKADLFVAAASIHGRAYTAEQAAGLVTPFYNMASKNEGEQPEFMAALPPAIKEKSKFKHFHDVPHGFAASKGQWATDETHRKRAEEAVEEFVSWVKTLV